jgi:hypothetical protein
MVVGLSGPAMSPPRRASPRKRRTPRRSRPKSRSPAKFVGRDASPVLDRYPPKDPALAPRGPPTLPAPTPPAASSATSRPPDPTPTPPPPSGPLITLDRPFDPDEFSALLGETSIRVTVPRDALPEVLRRITEFMDFGIYVYSVSIRPAPSELLKSFVVELQRVDFSAEKGVWVAFVEKGTTDSPFGPAGDRR